MNDYYVYEWIRLDTNEPFYVGKGHGERWKMLTRGNNHHFNNIVKKTDVVVNILHDNLSETEAYEIEVYYIWLYRDEIGYELCNITDGGDGCICRGKINNKSIKVVCLNNGYVYDSMSIARERHGGGYFDIKKCCEGIYNHAGFDEQLGYLSWCYYEDYINLSEEEIQQRIFLANNSKCGERNSFYGKHHSDETKQKLKEIATGRTYSEDTKKKLSELRKGEKNHMFGKRGENNPNFGKKCSEETKNKLREIMVLRFVVLN